MRLSPILRKLVSSGAMREVPSERGRHFVAVDQAKIREVCVAHHAEKRARRAQKEKRA